MSSIYPKESREAACNLLSACACECFGLVWSVFIARVASVLFRDERVSKVVAAEAIELAGLAWRHANIFSGDLSMGTADLYAEAEALVREGWEPSDDE